MSTAAPFRLLLPLHPPLTPRRPSAPVLPSVPRRGTVPSLRLRLRLSAGGGDTDPPAADELDCVGTGADVECVVDDGPGAEEGVAPALAGREWWEWVSLVSPFFFWGTAMVAMKGVIPKTGPFFVAALRLLPAGLLVVAFAAARGRKQPSGWAAWGAIAAFGLIDAACFQGFLTEGLQKTSAGPNALTLVSICVDAVRSRCLCSRQPPVEVCVFLNDLPDNDFNMVVKSLVAFQQSHKSVVTGVIPGSFYGRLFTSGSLHLVC